MQMLRGGAFKPRTSPYAFQGLGATGIEYRKVARQFPRSQRITFSFPLAMTYSALISHSSKVADMPRLIMRELDNE